MNLRISSCVNWWCLTRLLLSTSVVVAVVMPEAVSCKCAAPKLQHWLFPGTFHALIVRGMKCGHDNSVVPQMVLAPLSCHAPRVGIDAGGLALASELN